MSLKLRPWRQKKLILDQRVAEGKLNQEQADAIYNRLAANQAACDGTGSAALGKRTGAGFGQGSGKGLGQGQGRGVGMGQGQHNGLGMGQGNGGGMGRDAAATN